jgi:micrococcal nuclease
MLFFLVVAWPYLLGTYVAVQLGTLAYLVRADGWDYSIEAARAGTAHSYVYGGVPVSRYDAIEAAEAEARDAHRGPVGSAVLRKNGAGRTLKADPAARRYWRR